MPVRAIAVSALVAVVGLLSARVGPDWSGMLAAFPIVLTSMTALLQPRIGGPAMAAVIANMSAGLMGFVLALGLVHATAEPLGSAWSLVAGLVFSTLWNLSVLWRGLRRF